MMRPPRRKHGALGAAYVGLLLAVSLLIPAHVQAHAELASSDPAANSSLPASPERLALTFTEPIDLATARISLLDDRQTEVSGLGAISVDAPGTTATVQLPSLQPGVYTVSYQVTSATPGNATTGICAFLVDPTGAEPAPTLPSSTSSPASGPDVVAARWLALVSTLGLLGMSLFWLVSARPALARAGETSLAPPWGLLTLLAAGAAGGLVLYLTLSARPIVEAG